MSLFKYFKKEGDLPNPNGHLSKKMPSSAIVAANKEVKKVQDDKTSKPGKRGPYSKFSPQIKAEVGKQAAECGVAAVLRNNSKKYPDL